MSLDFPYSPVSGSASVSKAPEGSGFKNKVTWRSADGAEHSVRFQKKSLIGTPKGYKAVVTIAKAVTGQAGSEAPQKSKRKMTERKVVFNKADIDDLLGANLEMKVAIVSGILQAAKTARPQTAPLSLAEEQARTQAQVAKEKAFVVSLRSPEKIAEKIAERQAADITSVRERVREKLAKLEWGELAKPEEKRLSAEALAKAKQEIIDKARAEERAINVLARAETKAISELAQRALKAPFKYREEDPALKELKGRREEPAAQEALRQHREEMRIQLTDIEGQEVKSAEGKPLEVRLKFRGGNLYAEVRGRQFGSGGAKNVEDVRAWAIQKGAEDVGYAYAKLRDPSPEAMAELALEIRILNLIEENNVPCAVKRHVIKTEKKTGYAMVPYPKGSANKLTKVPESGGRYEGFELGDRISGTFDIADFLDHLHKLGYMHGDIKSDNAFITERDAEGRLHVDVGDFGTVVEFGKTIRDTTRFYEAPELKPNRSLASPAQDMFALGRTLHSLVYGMRKTSVGRFNESAYPPLNLEDPIDNLISRLCDPDPNNRPTAAQARAELDVLRARYPSALPGREAFVRAESPVPSNVGAISGGGGPSSIRGATAEEIPPPSTPPPEKEVR